MSMPNATTLILVIPVVMAFILALLRDYRVSARLNMLAALLTLLSALTLLIRKPEPGP